LVESKIWKQIDMKAKFGMEAGRYRVTVLHGFSEPADMGVELGMEAGVSPNAVIVYSIWRILVSSIPLCL
jgi:hypothetical protein